MSRTFNLGKTRVAWRPSAHEVYRAFHPLPKVCPAYLRITLELAEDQLRRYQSTVTAEEA